MKMGGEKKEERWKARVPAKVSLTEINEYLMCQLCIGYLIDATAIIECQHTFCKSCILKYLENNSYCPICEVQLNIAKPLLSLRSDENLQKLVYKLVPGLVNAEILRRKEFSLKLSTDEDPTSVEGLKEAEELCFLSPDDPVTLSLEYFKGEEGDGDQNEAKSEDAKSKPEVKTKKSPSSTTTSSCEKDKANDRRYLSCPAAVSVGILKKFIRQKYGLSDDYRVDLLYNGDSENNLENELTLLDLSFIYKWKKDEPMCFHYRIFDRPSKNVPARPAIKRTAPSVLDEPPPDDAPPSAGQLHPGNVSPSTKQPRLGDSTSSGSSTTSDTKSQTNTASLVQAKGQLGSSKNVLGRGKGTPTREDDEGASSSPAYSPQGSGSEGLSPIAKNSSVTTTSSSSESPTSPLKISIKDEKSHRHRHHRHKEKHKKKSKSKSKSKEREKSKEKDRYKYNAHPNPTQSQTISVKPSGKHKHRHHHHKNREKDEHNGVVGGVAESVEKGSSAAIPTTVEGKSPVPVPVPNTQPQQRARSSSVTSAGSGGLEKRPAVTGLEMKPISNPNPVPKPSPAVTNGQSPPVQKVVSKIKIPDALQLQVPKSVTLIPVTPGTSKSSSRDNKATAPPRPNSSQTFTHPITNKSLHQITVTEVPPPGANASKGSMTPPHTAAATNVITIEKCSPNPSHSGPASKQLFNGPGSMEITKIYCDTGASAQVQVLPGTGLKVKSQSAVFESHSQKKLKGLDISITPTPPSYAKPQGTRKDEQTTNFAGKLNVAGIPKIPGVSILPQAVHNANKEQQRKFNNNSGSMSFSCMKINPEANNSLKVNNVGGRLLSGSVDHQRSPSPATNGKQGKLSSRKGSADSVYDNSRGPSPSPLNQQRNMSLPISIVNTGSNSFSHGGFGGEHGPKKVKRSLESALPLAKKARIEPVPATQGQLKPQESLPLDLSGRSSRLTPPGTGENRPVTPVPLQSSPKLSHKSQSTTSIDSIAENLTQKHQRSGSSASQSHQRSSVSSNSSKDSLSPPNPGSSPPMTLSPHSQSSFHSDLLTLSNAAATARKMSNQKTPPGNAMSNLLAAANAMAFNCSTTGLGPAQMSPTSAAAAASYMLPGLLHQLGHHHQLNSMMLSPPGGLTGPQGIKTSMLGQSGIYGGYPGLNGRLPVFGPPMGQSPVSPPFYPSRSPTSNLKIPTLNSSKTGNKSPTSIVPPASASNGTAPPKGSKSPKTNGSSPSQVTMSPQPKPKPTPSSSSTGATFSFGISNFLKDSTDKTGLDPNAKAIVTSSSAGMLGQGKSSKMSVQDTKGKTEQRSKVSQSLTKSPPQTLPVSKFLGFESQPPSSRTGSAEPTSQNVTGKTSRLGDLGLALGLIPCDPPVTKVLTDSPTKATVTSPPNSFSIPSLLPPPPPIVVVPTTVQQQNQAVRQIPNPSLLSSRVNYNNPGGNNGDGRNWKSVTNKGPDAVTVSKPQEPQSIELNMRLWIDRYESGKSKVPAPPKEFSDEETNTKSVKGNKSPQVTFSASVPSPPTMTIETGPLSKSEAETSADENPLRKSHQGPISSREEVIESVDEVEVVSPKKVETDEEKVCAEIEDAVNDVARINEYHEEGKRQEDDEIKKLCKDSESDSEARDGATNTKTLDDSAIVIQPQFGTMTLMNEAQVEILVENSALDSGIGDEKSDSPALLVIDEEDVSVQQEEEVDDNEHETEDGAQSEIQRSLEIRKETAATIQIQGTIEDPPITRAGSLAPSTLPARTPSPTLLIGSEGPLSTDSLETDTLMLVEDDDSPTSDLEKVAATMNNNNNVSPDPDGCTGTELIPMTSITPPPLPTTTN